MSARLHSPLNNYQRFRRFRRRRVRVYYRRLLKASLLISTIPAIGLAALVIYQHLSLMQAVLAFLPVMIGSMVLARPYLADLSSLTQYVEQLALDRTADAPSLSFLGNVEELSQAVKSLHASWGARKMELEAAVAESKVLFDTLPDMLIMLDEKLRVVRANNAAFLLLGQKIIGMPYSEAVQNSLLENLAIQVMERGKGKEAEFTRVTEHGSRDYLVRMERFPIYTPGGIALVVVMSDVTDTKRSKQMIKDFVANASHEIRTPLTSLVGFIETLQTMEPDEEEERNPESEARRKFLSIMAEQAAHMNKLVGDLLSLSKIEMNETTLPTGSVQMKKIAESALRRMEWAAEQKKIKINLTVESSLPSIRGDEDELMQVCVNLIGNAIKYSTPETQVRVTVGVSETLASVQGLQHMRDKTKAVFFSVNDQGEGIAPDDIPRLTERFYRVDKVRSRKAGGTGLGLSIVKHILNRHRADLVIESELGKGSIFTIYLPITQPQEIHNGEEA